MFGVCRVHVFVRLFVLLLRSYCLFGIVPFRVVSYSIMLIKQNKESEKNKMRNNKAYLSVRLRTHGQHKNGNWSIAGRIEGAHDGDVNCVRFSTEEENLLVSCGDDEKIKLWTVEDVV